MPTLYKRLLFFLGMLLAWESLFRANLWPEFLFPSPISVARTLISGFTDGSLLLAVVVSLQRLLTGYGLAMLVGIPLGFLMARVVWLKETLGFLVLGLQTVPSVVWLPLALLWFGLGDLAIIFVVSIGATLTMVISAESGVKNIPPIMLRAARTMGARGWKLFLYVVVPSTVPAVMTGMRLAWAFAWRALIAGELIGSGTGLGQILMIGRGLGDMSLVLAVMLIIACLGVVLDNGVFKQLEERVLRRWGLATGK